MVDYVIIGGEFDGQIEPWMIQFICKSDINKKRILDNEFILRNKTITNGESEDYIPVLDIYSNQQYYIFEQNENG